MNDVQEFFVNIFYFCHDFKNCLLVTPQSLTLCHFILKLQLSINCLSSIFSNKQMHDISKTDGGIFWITHEENLEGNCDQKSM